MESPEMAGFLIIGSGALTLRPLSSDFSCASPAAAPKKYTSTTVFPGDLSRSVPGFPRSNFGSRSKFGINIWRGEQLDERTHRTQYSPPESTTNRCLTL